MQDWCEGDTDPGGEEGGEDCCGPHDGDASWLHTCAPGDFWTNPGGDFIAAASAMAIVDQIQWYEWLDPQMVTDVQMWLDDPSTDFGWLMKGEESFQVPPSVSIPETTPRPMSGPYCGFEYTVPVPVQERSVSQVKSLY